MTSSRERPRLRKERIRTGTMAPRTRKNGFSWEIDVPLVTNRVVMRQLAVAVVLSAGFVALLLFTLGVIDNNPTEMRAAAMVFFLVLGIFVVLMAIATLLVLGNRMRMTFKVDERGARSLVVDKRAKAGRWLATLLGFITLNPTLASAGLLAEANKGRNTKWPDVKRLEVLEGQKTIVLHGKMLALDAIFCTPDNFDQVLSYIESQLPPEGGQ